MKRFWTKQELYRLRRMYPNRYTSEIAERLNRPISSVYQYAAKMGLKKSEAFHRMEMKKQSERLTKTGAANRFKKGHQPMNKGRKQVEYMDASAIENTKATRFAKGHLPHNTKQGDGEITIRRDKNGTNYKHYRVSLSKWVAYQRVVWENNFGPIPKGMLVVFKDFDTMNCEPENLMLLTRRENMLRNSVHNLPKPLAQAVQLRGALNRQINKHIKKTEQ